MGLAWNTNQLLSQGRTGDPPVEFHFLTHREIYDSSILTADRYHSSAGGWAVFGDRHWYTVEVVTRPVYTLPQELCLSFDCFSRTKTLGNTSTSGPPIEEVALEYGMLLSLLAREPLIPLGTRRIGGKPVKFDRLNGSVQRMPPANTAPPAGINSGEVRKILTGLAQAKETDTAAIFAAIRFYHAALSIAHYDVSTAYFSLVSAMECVAGHHFADKEYNFDEVEKFSRARRVLDKIGPQLADSTLLDEMKRALLKSEHFVGQKFRNFIEEFLPKDFWNPDELHPDRHGLPEIKEPDLRRFVKEAYTARSKYAHTGEPFPAHVAIGLFSTVSTDALMQALSLLSSKFFVPPFFWFERLTHSVLREYIRRVIAEQ